MDGQVSPAGLLVRELSEMAPCQSYGYGIDIVCRPTTPRLRRVAAGALGVERGDLVGGPACMSARCA